MENNKWYHFYSPITKIEYYNWCMSQREIKLLYLSGIYWFLKPFKLYFKLKEFFVTRSNYQKLMLGTLLICIIIRIIEIMFFDGTI